MQIGYMGIVVPALDFYQGYFIDDAAAKQAAEAIDAAKAHPVARDYNIVGQFSATAVRCALHLASLEQSGIDQPQVRIAVCGYALHRLTDLKYFWINAERTEKGTSTRLTPLNAKTIAQARNRIHALPSVIKIQQRLAKMPPHTKH